MASLYLLTWQSRERERSKDRHSKRDKSKHKEVKILFIQKIPFSWFNFSVNWICVACNNHSLEISKCWLHTCVWLLLQCHAISINRNLQGHVLWSRCVDLKYMWFTFKYKRSLYILLPVSGLALWHWSWDSWTGDNMVDWLAGWLVGWLVGFVLFNAGALHRRKIVNVLVALCSSPRYIRYLALHFSFLFVLFNIWNILYSVNQFLGRDKDEGVQRSAISGKKVRIVSWPLQCTPFELYNRGGEGGGACWNKKSSDQSKVMKYEQFFSIQTVPSVVKFNKTEWASSHMPPLITNYFRKAKDLMHLHWQIMMKLEKSKEDKQAESKRNELLKFLNASYDWQFVGSAVICCLLDLSWYYRLVHQCCWLYLQVFCSLLF